MIFFTLFLGCGSEDPETKAEVTEVASASESTTTSSPKTATDVSSSECSQMLKEYEGFVDSYIDTVEKAAKGDASAMSSYPELMKKAETIGNKIDVLQKKNGDLDTDCFKKYNALTMKMAKAGSTIAGGSPADQAELDEAQKAADKALDMADCMQKCQSITDMNEMTKCIQGCQ